MFGALSGQLASLVASVPANRRADDQQLSEAHRRDGTVSAPRGFMESPGSVVAKVSANVCC